MKLRIERTIVRAANRVRARVRARAYVCERERERMIDRSIQYFF